MEKETNMHECLLDDEDLAAVEAGNHAWLNNVGANYYAEGDYEKAKIYYEIASTMGNTISSTNLGYIYMYGRNVPVDYSVALAFYKIGAKQGNIEALYKLGNLYQSGKGVEKDVDVAIKYYEEALNAIENSDEWVKEDYPSVYFTIAKEMLPNGLKETNIEKAYEYLKIADNGYTVAIEEMGADYYKTVADEVKKLLNDSMFDEYRK